jgi:hypothetical protein
LESLLTDDSRKVSAAAEGVVAMLAEQDAAEEAAAREAERARQEAERLLSEASERLSLQDLAGALKHVDAARTLDPSSTEAIALRDEIQHAIDEAHQKEELERESNERRESCRARRQGRSGDVASTHRGLEALTLTPTRGGRQLLTQLGRPRQAATGEGCSRRSPRRDRIEEPSTGRVE